MMMVQKLTTLAYSYHDGLQTAVTSKSKLLNQHKITTEPTLLEILAYSYGFFGVIAGPFCYFNEYLSVIQNDKNEIKSHNDKSVHLKLIKTIFCFLMIYLLDDYFPASIFKNEQFLNETSLVKKILLCSICTPKQRLKYYSYWYLADCINNYSGFGYDPKPKNKNSQEGDWDGIINCRPSIIETAPNIQVLINNWNIGTTKWLRIVAFERVGLHPKYKSLRHIATFSLSCIWHGFWPGYYFFFLNGHFTLQAYKNFKKYIRPRIENLKIFGQDSLALKIYEIVGMLCLHLSFNFATICFTTLLSWENCWRFYKSCYFVPPGLVIVFGILPFVRILGDPKSDGCVDKKNL